MRDGTFRDEAYSDSSESYSVQLHGNKPCGCSILRQFTSIGGENEFEVVGTPLPPWEDFKHTETGKVHERFLDKRKRNKEAINAIPKPKCIKISMPDGKVMYRL